MRQRKSLEVERVEPMDPKTTIFRLAGKLVGTQESYDFLDDLRDDVQKGRSHVVLNLDKVDRVTSPGIGIIAACYTSTKKVDGRLCLVAVPQPVRTLMELVCLWPCLEHYATEEEALAAFAK